MKDKIVYTTMTADLFHRGHLEFIKKAKAIGDYLIIGLHPDDIIRKYKREPVISFEERKSILEAIIGVNKVVEDCMDFRQPTMLENLKKYKVNVAVHADDWLPPCYLKAKKEKICKVKQLPYHYGVSTTHIIKKIKDKYSGCSFLKSKDITVVSAGDAITAKLVEQAGFDGIWISGFEASARLGLPDNGAISLTEMLNIAKPIVDSVNLPIFVDVDTGYGNFRRTVHEFEKIGVSGICVEDNVFPKQNSLWGGKIPLLSIKEFVNKINIPHKLKIIARTEKLIRGGTIGEACQRALTYYKAGADMILIHSRESTGKEALAIPKFLNKYGHTDIPLVIIPTKFPHIKTERLFKAGFSMCIWANQTERVKIKAIRDALRIIKKYGDAYRIEKSFSATLDDMKGLTPDEV